MVIRVYVSGISGNKEVKKRQQRVLMILESKNIPCEIIDITEPGKESDKEFMQQHSKPRGDQKHPLPPQIFNDEEYCGDFLGFDLANENDKLLPFLKMAVPEPSPPPEVKEEPEDDNKEAELTESESEELDLKPSRPRPRPPPKAVSADDTNAIGAENDENDGKNLEMEDTSQDEDQESHKEHIEEHDVSEDQMTSQDDIDHVDPEPTSEPDENKDGNKDSGVEQGYMAIDSAEE